MTKLCNQCGITKDFSCYYKHSTKKVESMCIDCKKQLNRAYYLKNKNKIIKKAKNKTDKQKERQKEYAKEYYQQNKSQISKQKARYVSYKYTTDPVYRFMHNMKSRIRIAIKGATKAANTKTLLGCTGAQARKYLEAQFTDGMSWDNYGLHGWHIDHIIPCSSFDLTDPEQQKHCFHYTNLQPLWAEDNLRKSNKLSHSKGGARPAPTTIKRGNQNNNITI